MDGSRRAPHVIGDFVDLQIDGVSVPIFVAVSTKLDEVILAADHAGRQHAPPVVVNVVGGRIRGAIAKWHKQVKSNGNVTAFE